ncbi:MAG: T9SS type A sorting domain-containing protein, partial [Bacteroidales bacterium]|nr:T9SS type A sorting domain-containing protein [Bacteroidales bacterium]
YPYLPGAADFPDANMAYEQLIQSTQVINYYKKDSSGFYNLGSRTQAANPYSIVWNPPKPDELFPVDANTPLNIPYLFSTENHSDPNGTYQTNSHYSVTVDQWGDLDIISGTYSSPVTTSYQNCIRTKTISTDTLTVDASGTLMHFYVKSIYLAWYAPGISDAVLFFSFAQVRNDLDPLFWTIDPVYAWHDEGEWYFAVPYIPVNIEDNTTVDNHIFIYPNPAKDQVTIAGNNIDKIEILNITGQKIIEKECTNHHITTIDVSNLPAGNYVAKITGNGKVITKKINKL